MSIKAPGHRRVALYARVSTELQCTDNQLLDLRRHCSERGWKIAEEFIDHGVSGTKVSRPALDKLMDAARRHQFDTVIVWKFDRMGRSVKHLVLTLDELRSLSIDFISFNENVDTSTPLGQAIFTIIAAMAALERDIIVERVHAGLRRAKAEGKRLGRPKAIVDRDHIGILRKQGLSFAEIAARLGSSKATICRVSKSMA